MIYKSGICKVGIDMEGGGLKPESFGTFSLPLWP